MEPSDGSSAPDSRLSRRLGTRDAVAVGLGAMIGTGVFVAWRPAASQAGSWMLAGLGIAAFVAYCNATSTAQLAAAHPRAGGAYHYGRERLGPHWGALAGYAFVIGKTASCATAALAVGSYLWPGHATVVALAAVVVATAVDLAGVTKTAGVTTALVAFVVVVLVAVAVTVPARLPEGVDLGARDVDAWGVLGSAAVLFYAFAGYARITSLGEEVRDPQAIPRAVTISLVIVLVIYAAVGAAVLMALGPDGAARAEQPLRAVVDAVGAGALFPFVVAAAAAAALGALLSLLAGIGRTSFAMAADGDLPRALAAVHATRRVPHRAELAAAGVTCAVVLAGDVAETLAASAFAVLVYYAVANAAAWRLPARQRSRPRALAALGFVSCLVLAVALPWRTVVTGSATLAAVMLVRTVVLRLRRPG